MIEPGQNHPDLGWRDHSPEEIEAARLVLAELMEMLEEYRDGIVLVAAWVPYFAIFNPQMPHEGTIDIDLALNGPALQEDGFDTIEDILNKSLYQQDTDYPFRWYRALKIDGADLDVPVEFLTGETTQYPEGRLQKIQDIHVSTIRGCDIAFKAPVETMFSAPKPNGEFIDVKILRADVPQFLTMKGLALHSRDARKDAYDIYYIIRNYEGGLSALVAAFEPYRNDALVRESLQKIAAKWQGPADRGPMLVASHEVDIDERRRLQRDVYEQVNALLSELQITR